MSPDARAAPGPWPLPLNRPNVSDGRDLLRALPEASVPLAIFDPQYRGILDRMSYGNEGKNRGQRRSGLRQMPGAEIAEFIAGIARALRPSGHLMLWVDKYHLCTGVGDWLLPNASTGSRDGLSVVDLVTWNKDRMGMGYRTRRHCEYLLILQKPPRRAKGVWRCHDIPDVWTEKAESRGGVHPKPVGLQRALIAAVTGPGDVVLDPAAGSYTALRAARAAGRDFLGCDVVPWDDL